MHRIPCAVSILLLLGSLPGWGQQDRATITGIVTDPSGSVIPAVDITIRNTATNASYTAVTNAVGIYTAPNLLIGPYRLSFAAAGFKTMVQEGIALTVSQVARIDIQIAQPSSAVCCCGPEMD